MDKKRILTGDRPTGRLHLGHYFGSLSKRVSSQDDYDCFFILADLHTLTTRPHKADIAELSENILQTTIDYLAVGIDPEKSTIFVQSAIPQIFELIQRIFVLVADNLRYLQTREEFVTICHPTEHIGNIDPFRITIFVLNLRNMQRKVHIQAQTSMSSLDPDDASQMLLLDIGELELPPKDIILKFSSSTEPIDVLRIVSSILQVGDVLNLQFRPNRSGTHVLNISIDDPEIGIITGRSVVIDVSRDLRYFLKTVGGKVLGYAGAAVSLIGISMGSLVGLFGF